VEPRGAAAATREPGRVVFFSHYTGLGGGETSLLALLGALDRTRFRPALVCPREGQLPEAARALGIEVRLVPYRGASAWFVPGLWARLPGAARIEAAVAACAPAVVHTDFHTLPYAAPACQRLGTPLVFTCYGWWFRPKPWQRAFYRARPAAILAISEAVRRGFLGMPPALPPECVQLLPLGVDTGRFRPLELQARVRIRADLKLPADGPLVTLLARFQRVKGHDLFLAAARRIADRCPEAHFVLAGENVFGGSGDERFKREVHAAVAADTLLRPRVRFLGWVPSAEALLAASDVVVCPSRFESFGLAPVEAMACGVPVVSTDVGGPSETVADGETGYLVPPERTDLFAERVVRLLLEPALRERFGAAGRARVCARFSLEQYVAGFARVLEAVEIARP
jgi:glycosyltransferase involved in cell wall biosynthesis